jgi:hypothetical protein
MNSMAFRKVGLLAKEYCDLYLPLQVMLSQAGYYLGTCDDTGPVSRESLEYFSSYQAAERALFDGDWTQRETP